MKETKKTIKICHFTSAHEPTDDRIFLKECQSLQQSGYEVFIVGKGTSEEKAGIRIIGCAKESNRIKRLLCFSRAVYRIAKNLNCDIYHFHDPELLPYGLKLKKAGAHVIFDSHEDVPAQILDKQWIPAPLRKVTACLYRRYETHVVKQLDAVVAATPYIAKQFEGRAKRVVVINNYPKLDDIQFHDTPFEQREPIICYAGGISELRGEKVMVEAMKGVEGMLVLAGPHEKNSGDKYPVIYLGFQDRAGINELYGKAVCGLCLLAPIQNYLNSQPIKVYEYMAAGLPFICSDFPAWRKLAEQTQAGLCVDYTDTTAIRKAIIRLLSDRQLAQQMGLNGRKAVETHYCWSLEASKLNALYSSMACTTSGRKWAPQC